MVAAARDAATHNRNAAAAELFQRALALAPSRRQEWVRELADQLAYAQRAEEAIPLYQEALAAKPAPQEERQARLGLALALSWSHHLRRSLREYEGLIAHNAGDLEARLGRARVLSWSDRHQEAQREYESVLRQEPGNVEALRGRGRIASWQGRQREAERRLGALLRDHPGDPEGSFLLAQSEYWLGCPDQAKRTLADLRSHDPGNTEAGRLSEEIRQSELPNARVDFQSSDQSDHLGITVQRFHQELHLGAGRTTIGAQYERYLYDPGHGLSAITVDRPGLFARRRLSNQSELTASLSTDLIQPAGQTGGHTVLTYDTYLTLWPNDRLRFDIGSNRTTFDNITSLTRGVSATYATFSMDLTPDEKTRFSTRANWGAYTDGNERGWLQLEAERRLRTAPNLLLGARYTGFGFSRTLANGYFNPSGYHALVATARLQGPSGRRFSYDLDGAFGREHSSPGGGRPYSSASARLSYRIGKRMDVQGYYQFFSSRQASSGGFARRTTGLSFHFLL